MRKDSLRLLMFAGVVAFAVLYGMELSSKGISEVYGPMDQPAEPRQIMNAQEEEGEDWTLPPQRTVSRSEYQEEILFPRNDRQPLVDQVSAAAAKTLHTISSGGIRFVVSLFDKVTGS